ncbi:Uncharacterized protein PKNOH_S110100600 [Plasmodium knowlesi]|uniref:Uncharacterized protein n=1 Tax=Plasmodium knowlesi TaxID=5850 RepID=A0A1Y3DLP2_PLAKN|nr:Uncharacterized protein PKNOH_S110100600 [Plasmodium knowlesi]
MDNLFTININPDENVRLNINTEKDLFGNLEGDREGLTVPPDEEYNENNNNHPTVEENEVLTVEIDQISTSDSFDILEELSEDQINDYENMRKKIRAHILTSFQKDNILIEAPEHLEADPSKEHDLERNENKLLKLRKDKIYVIVSSSSQEKNKKSRQNEANSRYYYDPNVVGEDAPTDYDNFLDVLLGRVAPGGGVSPPSEGVVSVNEEIEKKDATEVDEESAAVEGGEENDAVEGDEENDAVEGSEENDAMEGSEENTAIDAGVDDTGVDSNDQVETVEVEEEIVQEEDAHLVVENTEGETPKGEMEESEELCAESCIETCQEICPDDSKSNHVVEDFREKIKNWLVKFPDINSENLFFHFYFQSELYKDKKHTCQNCGSSDCDREFTFKHVCENTYCFLCYKRVTGPMCHNTKTQYVAFKANSKMLISELKYIHYPYKSMSCLNCFSNDHLKCGRPPYVYARHTHNVRREYNNKLDPSYFVYMKNPRNVWFLHECKPTERKGNTDANNNSNNNNSNNNNSNNNSAVQNVNNQSGQSSTSGGNASGYGRNNKSGGESSKATTKQERVGSASHIRKKGASNFSSKHNVHMVQNKHSYDSSKHKAIVTRYSSKENIQRNKQKRNFDTYDAGNQNNFHWNNKRHKNDPVQSSNYYDYKNKQQVVNDKRDNISDIYTHGQKYGSRNRDSEQYSSKNYNKNRYVHESSMGDYYNNNGRGQDNRNSAIKHSGSYYNIHNEINKGAKGYTTGQIHSPRSSPYKYSSTSSSHFSNPRGTSVMKPNVNSHVNKNNLPNVYRSNPNNQHTDDNLKRSHGRGNLGSYSAHNSNLTLHKYNHPSGNALANTFAKTSSNTFANTFAKTSSNTFANTSSNTFANTFANTSPNTFANTSSNTFANTFANTSSNAFSNTYSSNFANTFANTSPNTFANTSSNTFANTFANTSSNAFSNTYSSNFSNSRGGNTLHKNTYRNVHPGRGGYRDYR